MKKQGLSDGQSAEELLPTLARYLDYFHLLTEVGKTLTSTLNREELIEALMRSVNQLMEPQDWSLLLLDIDTGELVFDVVVGPSAETIKNLRLPMGEGIAGWVAEHREPTLVAKPAEDPRFMSRLDEATHLVTRSVLAVPLICRDELLGVLQLVRTGEATEPYNDQDLEVIAPLADFVAIALDNARSFQRVEELTLVDDWTGLFNARYLRQVLPNELMRAQRYFHGLSLLFVDLDNFKRVNDTYGHPIGSELLREVAQFIRETTRETDRTARYGGDEFVVIAPHTTKTEALQLAERLGSHLARADFTAGRVSGLRVTASIGVASYPDNAKTSAELVDSADRAMYMSKARGRNHVFDASQLGPR